jgi:hypothetical protein
LIFVLNFAHCGKFLHNRLRFAFPCVVKGGYVKVEEILAGIDQEIARLQHARNLLAGDQPRRGRPRGSTSAKKATRSAVAKPAKSTGRKKRRLSAEGRKRIAEAMRKRWAERKKTAGK